MNARGFDAAAEDSAPSDNRRPDGWPIFHWQGPDETDDCRSTLRRPTDTFASELDQPSRPQQCAAVP